jgi:hypothetical protein
MTSTTRLASSVVFRARTLLFATILAATSFAVWASPTEVPRPESLQPGTTAAYACADGPSFQGWLTSSVSSHPVITSSATGNVYGYISDVVDDWGCTYWWRYDGLVWARSSSRGNFAWGLLINSQSVSCNWMIGSTDYLKANSTSDCPDTDAEYANQIHLGDTGSGDLMNAVFHMDASPDARGDFAFIHSDCEEHYFNDAVRWDKPFGTGTAARPGDLCDPYDLDGTNHDQTITVGDVTPPNPPSTPDLAATSDTGTSSTDNITSDTTPTFTGTAEANAVVKLYDGATQVGSQTLTGGATAWSITSSTLGSGGHSITATATDAAGNTSGSSGALSITIDVTAPNPPSTPDLAASSDTGSSTTDNITSDTTPTFSGTAEANAVVKLYDGASQVGSQTLTGGATAWSITASTLGAGGHSITATATDAAGNPSNASAALSITIDTTHPGVSAFTAPASPTNATSLLYHLTFSEGVSGLARVTSRLVAPPLAGLPRASPARAPARTTSPSVAVATAPSS